MGKEETVLNKKEIELEPGLVLKDGEGCVVIDFGCYFPYANQKDMEIGISFDDNEKVQDSKPNHRYPNTGYSTLSRKYGKRVSRAGYPYIVKLGTTNFIMKLHMKMSRMNIVLSFKMKCTLTKEKPVCDVEIRYLFDEGSIIIETYERKDKYLYSKMWKNHRLDEDKDCTDLTIEGSDTIKKDEKTEGLVEVFYAEEIEMYSNKVKNVKYLFND